MPPKRKLPARAPAALDAETIDLKTRLYDQCSLKYGADEDRVLRQDDLLAFGIIPGDDVHKLAHIVQVLVNQHLFRTVTSEGTTAWQVRKAEEAAKYEGLSDEEALIYSHIDEAGNDGIWLRNLKTKTNLHDALLNNAIKRLESKNIIMQMKSIEFPSRKMFIKTGLSPSERTTGGPWYSDNELDQDLLDGLEFMMLSKIRQKTFYESKKAKLAIPQKLDENGDPMELDVDEQREVDRQLKEAKFAMPAGYKGYATLRELTVWLEGSGLVQTVLEEKDVQHLLEVMVHDDLIEKVHSGPDGISYRAVRSPFNLATADQSTDFEPPQNAFTEAPCGKCPVFDLCEEGGPVAPSNCEYFQKWLEF